MKSLAKQAGLKWLPFLFHLYEGLSISLTKVTEIVRNTRHPQPAFGLDMPPEREVLGSEQGWLKPRWVSLPS